MKTIIYSSISGFFILSILTLGQLAHAYDSEFYSYDQIVRGLSTKAPVQKQLSDDPFSQVRIHGGIGAATSFLDLRGLPNTPSGTPVRGIQVSLGIDLFSPMWMAEGTMRTFSENQENGDRLALKEFEIKMFYKTMLSRFLDLRAGIGMAGRYLRHAHRQAITDTAPAALDSDLQVSSEQYRVVEDNYSTLASVFIVGVDAYINSTFSLGTEIGYRSSMIEGSVDDKAVDALLRFDVHF